MINFHHITKLLILVIPACLSNGIAMAQTGCYRVITHQKISDTRGYFTGTFGNGDQFGSPAYLGDMNGDGIGDIAVGSRFNDDGGADRGAVWIIFLDEYGRATTYQKISSISGGFSDTLDNGDSFGYSLSAIGDIDNDGNTDLAVGAPFDDDGGSDRGAVWILNLNANGTVKSRTKISHTRGGVRPILSDGDNFGSDVALLGDINKDGFPDLGVGSPGNDDGGNNRGAVWVIFMDSIGKSIGYQKISDTAGLFNGVLNDGDNMGSICGDFDLNQDGQKDIAVGSPGNDDGGTDRGAIWIMFLDSTGKVISHSKISDTAGNFNGILVNGDGFGGRIRSDDIDADGIVDFVIGCDGSDDGGSNRGSFWIIYVDANGKARLDFQFSDTKRNFTGLLEDGDRFGGPISVMEDFNGDGLYDIAVAAVNDDDGGTDRGAVWIVSIGECYSSCSPSKLEESFFRLYAASGNDKAHAITRSRDSCLVICGTTNSNGAGGLDWFVLKVSQKGDTLWTRTFGSTSDETGNSISIEEAYDGNYIIAGRTYGFSTVSGGIYLMKISPQGSIIWQKKVDANSNEHGRSLEMTSDKGFIITGTNGYILKFDSSGTMQWNKYYSGGGNMHFMCAYEVVEKKQYMISGETTSYGSGGRSAYILALDSIGNKLWERIYDNTFEDRFVTLVQTPDKGFILVGSTQFNTTESSRRALIVKLDSAGHLVWSRHYSSGNSHDWALVIKKAKGSGYVLTGYSEGSLTYRNTLMKIDEYGNIEWGNAHIGNTNDIESYFGESLEYAKDGGYYFVSFTPDSNSSNDVFLSKINSCGQGACNSIPLTVAYKERELNTSVPVSSVTTWGTVSTVSSVVEYVNFSDSMSCYYSLCQLTAAFSADTTCSGDTTHFTDLSFDNLSTVSGWRWYFGDGDSAINIRHPTHIYGDSGNYYAKLVVFNSDTIGCTDTIVMKVRVDPSLVVDLGNDTVACQGETVFLDATTPNSTYFWSTASTSAILPVTLPGAYSVKVNRKACESRDTILVSFDPRPLVDLGPDTIFCSGDSFYLSAANAGAVYKWQDNSNQPAYFVSNAGVYWVEVTRGVCVVSDTITADIDFLSPADFGPDTFICSGQPLMLNAASPGASYLWQDASTGSFFQVTDSGMYWVEITSSLGICKSADTILIGMEPSPVVDLGSDTFFCERDSLVLNAYYPSASYLWNTSSTDSAIVVNTPGTYSVEVTLGLCSIDEIILIGIDSLPVVELGLPGHICDDDSLVLRLRNDYDSYLWSSGDTSYRAVFRSEGEIWVVVWEGFCSNTDTTVLTVDPSPLPVLPDSVILCLVPSVLLDAGNPGSYYDWSTGENTQVIEVSEEGMYTVIIINDDFCDLVDSTYIDRCVVSIFIPNTITPNGDGSNDTWFIKNIDQFPGNMVEIFNRDGYLLFTATNYGNDWNGTYKGMELPEAVYFYVVDLANGEKPYKGTITIVRE